MAPEHNEIVRDIRQNIFDAILMEKVDWAGNLNDVEFLGRLFDLKELPSTDYRFKNAARDIWQHTVNNFDWGREWVFYDDRFNLLWCGDDLFLRFLGETVHPMVRPNRDDAVRITRIYNQQLRRVCWELFEVEGIAGRPKYEGQRVEAVTQPLAEARRVADALDSGWMSREILRAEQAVEEDPDLAIGTAKDLIETCCKTLLGRLGEEIRRNADFPELVKRTVKALKLTRDDIPDNARGADIVRNLLSSLSAISRGVNELRNVYGTGHGREGTHKGLDQRHARLAVAAAAAFVVFISDTYHERE